MKHLSATIILLIMSPFALFANEPLSVGEAAPEVTVKTHLGESLDMADLYAKGPVAIYFYPRSFTGGCTKQACNIRDNYGELKAAGVTVVGVSNDPVDKQKAFIDEYSLPFILVADEDKTLGSAYKVNGYLGMAYKRQTFLVVDGKIAWRDLQAKPTTQTEDILTALKTVSSE